MYFKNVTKTVILENYDSNKFTVFCVRFVLKCYSGDVKKISYETTNYTLLIIVIYERQEINTRRTGRVTISI